MRKFGSFLLATMLCVIGGFAAAHDLNPAVQSTGSLGLAGCPVAYTVVGSWSGGFQASLSITNTGPTAINGWTVQWTFPDNQQITQLWGGNVTSQGESVTVTNLSWDATIAPGATMTSVGFVASGTLPSIAPAAFTLNGVACGSSSGTPTSTCAIPDTANPSQGSGTFQQISIDPSVYGKADVSHLTVFGFSQVNPGDAADSQVLTLAPDIVPRAWQRWDTAGTKSSDYNFKYPAQVEADNIGEVWPHRRIANTSLGSERCRSMAAPTACSSMRSMRATKV